MAKEKEQGEPPRERESIEGRNLSWMQIHRPPLVISDSIINVAAGWMDWLFAQHQQQPDLCCTTTRGREEKAARRSRVIVQYRILCGSFSFLYALGYSLMSVCTLSIELETRNQDESRA